MRIRTIKRCLTSGKRKRLYKVFTHLKRKYSKILELKRLEALDEGYEKGKTDYLTLIEHTFSLVPELPIDLNNLVSEDELDFDESLGADFLNYCRNELNYDPNPEQEKLILSKSRNSLAIAGAGSGKSTTLIYRLLFLVKYRFASLDEITVFSFTRASVAEFREKLINVFAAADIEVSQAKSEVVIRTFHSKVLEMAKNSILTGNERIFEFLSDEDKKLSKNKIQREGESNLDHCIRLANEEAVSISELSGKQNDLLYEAIDTCYENSERFKSLMNRLLIRKMRGEMDVDDVEDLNDFKIQKTIEADTYLSEWFKTLFTFRHTESIEDGREVSFRADSMYVGQTLRGDAYHPQTNTHIVFCPNYKTLLDTQIPEFISFQDGRKYKTSLFPAQRAYLFKHYTTEKVIFIRDQREADLVNLYLEEVQDEPSLSNVCPRFGIKLNGDIGFNELSDAFYGLGNFVESIGLQVSQICNGFRDAFPPTLDQEFAEALSILWPVFNKNILAKHNVIRFHDMFSAFSNENNTSFSKLDNRIKMTLSNIIIDEFQDISPEVANWIRATLRRMKMEHIGTTLMCVGDDYQSIYGWRGSSPEFILKYKNKFPSVFINKIPMNTNYRSYQRIVSVAESSLCYPKDKDKTGECVKVDNNFEERVFLNTTEKDSLENDAAKFITGLLKEVESINVSNNHNGRKEATILVMCRTRATKANIIRKLGYSGNKRIPSHVSFETFHTSKGLQATYCVMVEDCDYNLTNPLKNHLYALAGFNLSYDKAQKQESMRLAYVALTRAEEAVWWFAKADSQGSFLDVQRYVERSQPA